MNTGLDIKDSSQIQGLKIITPQVYYDFRGTYIETYNFGKYQFEDKDHKPISFVEDDISVSRKGVLRGLHGDNKTWKLIQCLHGALYEVVVDMRKDSSTYLNWETHTLNDENRLQLLVPAGCANGYLCLSEKCIFSYKQSAYYSGMENQFTIRWNDPRIQIYWPINNPILSQRDAAAPLLQI